MLLAPSWEWMLLALAINQIPYALVGPSFSAFIAEYSTFSFAMMLTPVLSGRIADRRGERVPISGGFLIVSTALLIFLQARSYPGFILVWAMIGAGVGLLSPAYQSLISKVVPRQSLVAFTGLFHGSLGLISPPAPWIGALLWERFNPRAPFFSTAALAILMALPTWLYFRISKNVAVDEAAVASQD